MQPDGKVSFVRVLVSELTVVLIAKGSRTSGLHTRTMVPLKLQSCRNIRCHAGKTDTVEEEDDKEDDEDDGFIAVTPDSL